MGAAVEAAFAAIGTVHRLMSFHDEESDVSRLNHGAFEAATSVHRWTFQVLETALDIHRSNWASAASAISCGKGLPRQPNP
jgi:FAD:protein FMN transferase